MNTVKIDGKPYVFPENIEEMNLDMWENIQAYVQTRNSEKYTYEDVLEIMNIVTGIDKKFILESPSTFFDTVFQLVKWVFEVSFDDIKPNISLKIDGKLYTYHENENITLREWIDIDTILAKFPDNQKFSGILAVRMREEGKIYTEKDSEKIMDSINFWKKQKVVDVMPLVGFFLLKEKLLLTNMKSYLMAVQLAQVQMKRIMNSVKNGAGTTRWWNLRKRILSKLTPFWEKESMKCYHTYLIWQTKVMQSMKQTEEFKIYNKK